MISILREKRRKDLRSGSRLRAERWERVCCFRHRLGLPALYWRCNLRRVNALQAARERRHRLVHPIAPRCSACGLSIDPRKWPDGPLWNKIEEGYVNAYREQRDAEYKQRKEEEQRKRESMQKRAAERKAAEDACLINRARRSLLVNAIFYSFFYYGILVLFSKLL